MARKNYASKAARRTQRAELPEIELSFSADVTGLWAVEMTNGSGRKVVDVYGTKATAWDWAETAGARGGVAEGHWWPVDITSAANLVRGEAESFILV